MRKIAKVDANQPHVVAMLRACGLAVQPLHQLGRGCPDLLVAGVNRKTDQPAMVLVELKADADGKLTDDEAKWIAAWPCEVLVVFDEWPVLRYFGIAE